VAGVHAMQGYLFAKPEPVAALKERLAAMRQRETMPDALPQAASA
jgi:EAL domain-containing protein (putative c-di-GMP-specific phosphodiesterase class I)